MKLNIRVTIFLLTSLVLIITSCDNQKNNKPNFIIVFVDDQGYQDLGCYGSPNIRTPVLDKMSEEGIRFTDFYVTSAVCSPSRASLITGRLPARHKLGGVVWPDKNGLNENELTIAEHLKNAGYATACFGKWHLGDSTKHLPLNQGFDEYFGIPYSNDMYIGAYQKISDKAVFNEGYDLIKTKADMQFVENSKWNRNEINNAGLINKVPLFEKNEIIEYPADQATLTKRYFDRAIQFAENNSDNPFFIYLTPAMPHIPLFASDQFEGKSEQGIYGDVIEEIDWNMGRLLKHLETKGKLESTLIIYTSDNGPWLGLGESSGSALPLRDGKFSIFEGGVRVPAIMYWKGKISPGIISNDVVSTLDLFPTLSSFANLNLSPNIDYDGIDISEYLGNPESKINRDTFFYSIDTNISAVRHKDLKYIKAGAYQAWQKKGNDQYLFNLREDISEENNLLDQMPKKIEEMERIIDEFKNNKLK